MTAKRFMMYGNTVYEMKNNSKIELLPTDCFCLLNELNDENEQLKQQLEYQQEVIVNTIDSLMDLPSATLYLFKQWLDTLKDFDSIEDMKNTFSERIKELEDDSNN